MPLIQALGRQRQADQFELKARLIYKARSRIVKTIKQGNPVSKSQVTTTTATKVWLMVLTALNRILFSKSEVCVELRTDKLNA